MKSDGDMVLGFVFDAYDGDGRDRLANLRRDVPALRPEHFTVERERQCYGAMLELAARNRRVDAAGVVAVLTAAGLDTRWLCVWPTEKPRTCDRDQAVAIARSLVDAARDPEPTAPQAA